MRARLGRINRSIEQRRDPAEKGADYLLVERIAMGAGDLGAGDRPVAQPALQPRLQVPVVTQVVVGVLLEVELGGGDRGR